MTDTKRGYCRRGQGPLEGCGNARILHLVKLGRTSYWLCGRCLAANRERLGVRR